MSDFMHDYFAKINAGDWQGAAEYYADDVIAHQSGHSKWSGSFEGKEAVLAWLNGMTSGLDSFSIDYHALTTGEGHAVLLNKMSATRGDKTYTGNRVIVYHVDDNKITELWAIDENQDAFNAFMS